MRRIFTLCFGVVLGCGLMYMGFQYHLVRTSDEYLLVPKKQTALRDAYVDVRGWTHNDWKEHQELVRDLSAAGHGRIVSSSVAEDFIHDILGSFRGDNAHSQSSAPLGSGND